MPGLSLIAPLVIWAAKREGDDLVYQNGRHVINFVLSFWLYTLGIAAATLASLMLFWLPGIMVLERMAPPLLQLIPSVPVFYFFFCAAYAGIYGFFHMVLPIYGALKALNGEVYRYPLTLTLLKEKDPYPQSKITGAK